MHQPPVDSSYFPPDYSVNANSTSGHPIGAEPTWINSHAQARNLGANVSSPNRYQEVTSRGSENFSPLPQGWGFNGPNATNADNALSYQSGQAADTPRLQNHGMAHGSVTMRYSLPQGNSDSVPLPTPTYDVIPYEEFLSDGGVKVFRCFCGKVTKSMGDMRRHHQSLKHSKRTYGCPWCKRMFTRKDGVNRHERNCKERRGFKMGTCDPHLIAIDEKPRKKRREE